MDAIGIIPARYASTRFEGKVLADLCGKPVIQHVYERAKQAKFLDDLIIACDDERVKNCVMKFGAKAVLTSPDQPTGTDRLTEVVNPIDVKIIVNIQGDEPFVQSTMIDNLVLELQNNKKIGMATIVKRIEDEKELCDPNTVKAVIDKEGYALYFSRNFIPFVRNREELGQKSLVEAITFYKHIGLYAYTKDFLFTFKNLPKSNLEEAEKLEQLRALEHGYRIKTIVTKFDTIGIDTPEDLEKAKALLALNSTLKI
ncbi:MAG: 3-deoxy-manno-octulosonate cytidylyltransferase [Candidatus Omnitrophica bacterium]|nr:3-deoxy-manno-octulosonate cytidylyltransferase [Candidatus Omnitrophota bacterium]